MKSYLKRSQANTPQKLSLEGDNDKDDFYLMVVSYHSDVYRSNKSKILMTMAESKLEGSEEEQFARQLAQLAACAVVDWSLPEEYGEYSHEKAVDFLFEYPSITDAVDSTLSNNGNFLEKK